MFLKKEPLTAKDATLYPDYRGLLRTTDEDKKEREKIIVHALTVYRFLIPEYTSFRLCWLGEKIKEYTTDERAHFIADILLINGYSYCPFIKRNDKIQQI